MPRSPRNAAAGMVYHVLNRGNLRARLFHKQADYLAFEKVLHQAHQRTPIEIFAWCLMPNHWHLVLRPRHGTDLATFMRWLTITHSQRWRAHSHTVGEGHLYQGRYKSFPVQTDRHFLLLCRYVERNALAAKLVEHAQEWRWTSLWQRQNPGGDLHKLQSAWPIDRPANWLAAVNRPLRDSDQYDIQQCILRNRPLGETAWQHRTAAKLGLEHTFRQRGRPKTPEKTPK